MTTVRTSCQNLLRWFKEQGRPTLARFAPDRVESVSDSFARLQQANERALDELPICFLGHAGVGKSTLLNTLIDDRQAVLPQGGVGPLTAQATIVRFSASPYLRVRYHDQRPVNKLLFTLERYLERTNHKPAHAPSDKHRVEIDEEDRLDAQTTVDEATSEQSGDKDLRLRSYLKRARLMIEGSQFLESQVDAKYLADSLRSVMGRERIWGTKGQAQDETRISEIRDALALAKSDKERTISANAVDRTTFTVELSKHASGFLSPLIKQLQVGWDSELLKDGITLVDLPGVGIAQDEHAAVTVDWIRQARAVILVVDRAGFTQESVDMLRQSRFLSALLHDDAPDVVPVSFIVSAVKMDSPTDDEWRDHRNSGVATKKWIEFFSSICDRMSQTIKGQAREQLQRAAADGVQIAAEARKDAIEKLLTRLEVHPVSSVEYRKFMLADDEDRPRVRSAEESRIPALRVAIRSVAKKHLDRQDARLLALATAATEQARTTLETVLTQLESNEREGKAVKRLQEELEAFLLPLRKEVEQRHGSFREFLETGLVTEIKLKVEEGVGRARDDVGRFLKKHRNLHWATLRAAIRKGGAFVGSAHIDMPAELTDLFEQTVTFVWTRSILVSLRKRTQQLGDDYVSMSEQLAEWSRGHEAAINRRHVNAVLDRIKADVQGYSMVGKELIGELREKVKHELFSRIQKRIRTCCTKFVDRHDDEGRGVQDRMHSFLRDELAPAVEREAAAAAIQVLVDNYRTIEAEVRNLVARQKSPVEQIATAILDVGRKNVKEREVKERQEGVRAIQEALTTFDKAKTGDAA